MILIKDLTKKYRSKNRRICTALNKINLALPDTGMIFIIGKSGSGKSTLLNMIGGLDSFDSGAIIADGNDLSRFRPSDCYKYRASYASFIFQDYHLIEELTVKENVKLALELEGEDKKDIGSALAAVDLAGYEERFPDELSGGQKQRVAIARALIKSPRVILCDEPTGNLDKNTSAQILDLLKSISKERLVLIVSHNMPDAEKYGDRIIELADGKVISDLSRKAGYVNRLELENGTLTLPYNHNLTSEEIKAINAEASKGNIRSYRQNDGGYEPTGAIRSSGARVLLKPSKMKAKTTGRLFAAFTKRGTLRSATTAFLSAMMLVLLIIFQYFLSFDGGKVISDSLAEQGAETLVLKKNAYYDEYGNMTKNLIYPINSEDLETIDEISENAKKYLLYSYSIRISHKDPTVMVEKEYDPPYTFDSTSIFTAQMAGTLVCDKDYLVRKFGQDGELKLLAGDLEQATSSYGIIITDYLADAMFYKNPGMYRSYADIIGPIYLNELLYGHVSAIVDTGYKDKYKDIIKAVAENKIKDQSGIKSIDEMDAMRILDDIKCNLSIGYSLNPNFTDAIMCMEARNFSCHGEAEWSSPQSNVVGKFTTSCGAFRADPNLNKGELLVSSNWVNDLFPDGNVEFPFTIEIERYEFPDKGGKLVVDKEYTVIGVKNNSTPGFSTHYIASEEDVLDLRKSDIVPYAIYIEDFEHADKIIDEMAERYFSWNSTNGTAVTLLNQSVSMFYELFNLFEILLIILIVVFLASYSIRNIRSNYYQIGVIKAIGGRSSDISKIYTAQTTILTIVVCILTYFGALYLVDVANGILIESFTRITKSAIGTINIITFDIKIVLYTMLTAFLLSMLSTVIPLLTLHRIKPVNIIKAKE